MTDTVELKMEVPIFLYILATTIAFVIILTMTFMVIFIIIAVAIRKFIAFLDYITTFTSLKC